MDTIIAKNKTVIYPKLSFIIYGILFEAHKNLGIFRNEKQYCDVIENLLKERGVEYEREKFLPISFTGEQPNRNRIDFIIEDKIILEVKAKPFITKGDYYQTKRYLISTNKKLAILINMRHYSITPKRILNSEVKEVDSDYLV